MALPAQERDDKQETRDEEMRRQE